MVSGDMPAEGSMTKIANSDSGLATALTLAPKKCATACGSPLS